MKKIVFVQTINAEYRIPFFKQVHEKCRASGIHFRLYTGQRHPSEGNTKDEFILPFESKIRNKYINLGKRRYLVWQPCLKAIVGADMVITNQATKNLLIYLLLLLKPFLNIKLCFWGHGKNFQAAKESSLSEVVKFWFSKKADHWFAYNSKTVEVLQFLKYPQEKITNVENAIDTTQLMKEYYSVPNAILEVLRAKHNITDCTRVGVFCSRLYYDKNIPFLLNSLQKIYIQLNKQFHFFVIGTGSEEDKIETFSQENSTWFTKCGALYGQDKAAVFRLSDIQIFPGLVGLHVLDSFATETPIVTTDNPIHSPEIRYLQDGENGLISEYTINDFVTMCLKVFNDKELLGHLRTGCKLSAKRYTIENMSANFFSGIQTCIGKVQK